MTELYFKNGTLKDILPLTEEFKLKVRNRGRELSNEHVKIMKHTENFPLQVRTYHNGIKNDPYLPLFKKVVSILCCQPVSGMGIPYDMQIFQ